MENGNKMEVAVYTIKGSSEPTLVNTKQPSDPPLFHVPWVRQVRIIAFEQAKYMRKSYSLVSGITKKRFQLSDRVNICIFVPVCYNSFNVSRIHELRADPCQNRTKSQIFKFKFKFTPLLHIDSL